jgi:hypothetical protein
MKSKSGSDFLVLWKYSEAPRVNALVMVGAEGTRHCGRGVSRGRAATAMSKLPTPRPVVATCRPERLTWQLLQSTADAGGASDC